MASSLAHQDCRSTRFVRSLKESWMIGYGVRLLTEHTVHGAVVFIESIDHEKITLFPSHRSFCRSIYSENIFFFYSSLKLLFSARRSDPIPFIGRDILASWVSPTTIMQILKIVETSWWGRDFFRGKRFRRNWSL